MNGFTVSHHVVPLRFATAGELCIWMCGWHQRWALVGVSACLLSSQWQEPATISHVHKFWSTFTLKTYFSHTVQQHYFLCIYSLFAINFGGCSWSLKLSFCRCSWWDCQVPFVSPTPLTNCGPFLSMSSVDLSRRWIFKCTRWHLSFLLMSTTFFPQDFPHYFFFQGF